MLLTERQIARILGEVLLFMALVIKEPYNRIFLPLLCALLVYSTFYLPSRASLQDYALTVTLFVHVCDGLDYLVIRDAQNKLRYKDQIRPASELPLLQRVKWALRLLVSPRAINWKHEHANSAPPHVQIKSRPYFLSRTLLDIFLYGLVFTIITLQIPKNPALVKGGPRLTELRWIWRLHGIFTWLILLYSAMQFQYLLFCLIVVICRFFDPEDCPPLFGSLFECFNIRRMWGQTYMASIFPKRVIVGHNILRLKLGSVVFGLVVVAVAFVTAGSMHSLGDYVLSGHYGGSMKFFCVQGFACVVETYATEIIRVCSELNWRSQTLPDHPITKHNNNIMQSSSFSKSSANRPVKFRPPHRASQVPLYLRLIGYVYILFWLYYTMPILLDPVLNAGILEEGVMNIWTGWTKNEWMVYPQLRENVLKYIKK